MSYYEYETEPETESSEEKKSPRQILEESGVLEKLRQNPKFSKWDLFKKKEVDKNNITIYDKIEAIGRQLSDSKNWEITASSNIDYLNDIQEYFGTNEFQTIFLILNFYNTVICNSSELSLNAIRNILDAPLSYFLAKKHEIFELRKNGFITIHVSRNRWDESDDDENTFADAYFSINEEICDYIINNEPLDKNRNIIESMPDFIIRCGIIASNYGTRARSIRLLKNELVQFESNYLHFPEIKSVKAKIENNDFRFLFYLIAYDSFFSQNNQSYLENRINQFYTRPLERRRILKSFSDDCADEDKNILIQEELIEMTSARMFQDSNAVTTDKGTKLLFGSQASEFKKKKNVREVVSVDKIKEKELFFEGDTEDQLNRISSSLENENFVAIQKRLEEKNMPNGIAILLYGKPGTGKTESVLQIAKKTNRDVYHIDISQAKTMWYGESPKRVKAFFNTYRSLCTQAINDEKNIPILLFNEADAIFSKRKDTAQDKGSTVQEDNQIQNVILEEMESLNGILIATTNIETNLDSAFERRFLFKVFFNTPDIKCRTKIWMNKISTLTESQAEELSKKYTFTGGEIENITRKIQLEEIITGTVPDFDKILDFCRTEKLNSNNNSVIGFND